MRKLAKALLLVVVLQLFAIAAVAGRPKSVLVHGDMATAQAISQAWDVTILKSDPAQNLFLLSLPRGMSAREFAERLGSIASPNQTVKLPAVEPQSLLQQSTVGLLDSAASTELMRVGESPIVFYYGSYVRQGYLEQPAAQLTHVLPAHDSATGDTVTVAIIDTGVDIFHPALAGALIAGYNFITNTSDVRETSLLDQSTVALLDGNVQADSDDDQDTESESEKADGAGSVQVQGTTTTVAVLNQSTIALLDQSTVALLDYISVPPAYGHGTAVAGIIRLVAPNSQVMPLKAFGPDGRGDLFDIVRAIRYAVDHGARVINMSFDMRKQNKELHDVIEYAKSHGVYCVSSAGNNGTDVAVFPAHYSFVTGVAATNMEDVAAPFTNFGRSAKAAAPGVGIITTFPGGTYALVSGTSFSAPFLAGGGALVASAKPGLNQTQVEEVLENTGVKINKLNPHRYLGKTRVDFVNALEFVLKN